jgi:hypothetical protein
LGEDGKYPPVSEAVGGVLTGGEARDEKLLIEEEFFKNWLILALLGEGGR